MEGEELQPAQEQELDPAAEAAAAGIELDEGDEGREFEGTGSEEGGEPGKVVFDDAQQGKFNEEMSKKTAVIYKERQRADSLQAQIDAINAAKPKPERPAIPPVPDQFADNAQELHAARDKAIADAARFDANELAASEQAVNATAAQEQQVIDSINVVTADYASRSVNLGIKDADLKQAGVVVAQGMNGDVVGHIVQQPNGPQITMYLSKNPIELEALNQMSPMNAAVHINSVIAGKASKAGTASQIPNPPKAINGKGAPEGDEGPAGATYR